MSLTGWRGGERTSRQPYPLPEEILLSRGPDDTTTRERDEERDRGPGGEEEARPLHLLPAREVSERSRNKKGGSRRRLFTFPREQNGTSDHALLNRTRWPPHFKRLVFQTTALSRQKGSLLLAGMHGLQIGVKYTGVA